MAGAIAEAQNTPGRIQAPGSKNRPAAAGGGANPGKTRRKSGDCQPPSPANRTRGRASFTSGDCHYTTGFERDLGHPIQAGLSRIELIAPSSTHPGV